MPRRFALLRGINVGGHTIRMMDLREVFEDLGFDRVSTFIASGNVIFDTDDAGAIDTAGLEARIEAGLRTVLGYDVATFIRTCEELRRIAAAEPFTETSLNMDGAALHVSFLRKPPSGEVRQAVLALRGESDDFRVDGREVYWLREGGRISDSPVGVAFGRTLGAGATMRNMNTVRRLAAKFCTEVST